MCHGYVTPLKIGSEDSYRRHRAARMNAKVSEEVRKHFKLADGTVSLRGGAKKWLCIACNKIITGSATKLRAHILGIGGHNVAACSEASEDAQNAIRAVEQEHPANTGKAPASSFVRSSSGSSKQPGIAAVFERLNKDEVDLKVAEWFYINGIAFNTVR